MTEAICPSVGRGVLHLFCKPTPLFDGEALVNGVKAAENAGVSVVTVAMLGHKADLAVMALSSPRVRARWKRAMQPRAAEKASSRSSWRARIASPPPWATSA